MLSNVTLLTTSSDSTSDALCTKPLRHGRAQVHEQSVIVNAAIRPPAAFTHLGVADEPVRLPWIASRRSPLTCAREQRRRPRLWPNAPHSQRGKVRPAEQSGPSCGCGRARACGPETARRGQCRRNRMTTKPGRHARQRQRSLQRRVARPPSERCRTTCKGTRSTHAGPLPSAHARQRQRSLQRRVARPPTE